MFMNTESNEREKEKMMMKKESFFLLSLLYHSSLRFSFFIVFLDMIFSSLYLSFSLCIYIYFFLSPPYDTFGM